MRKKEKSKIILVGIKLISIISSKHLASDYFKRHLPPCNKKRKKKQKKKETEQTIEYLLECIVAMGSQTFRLGLNFSPVCRHMVPSFPPIQNRKPSRAATPAEDL